MRNVTYFRTRNTLVDFHLLQTGSLGDAMPESRQGGYQTGDDGGDLSSRAKRLRAKVSGSVSDTPAYVSHAADQCQNNFSVVFDLCICYFWTDGETYSGPKRI